MPSCTEIGVVVALAMMTVIGFLVGFFIPGRPGQTDCKADKADPDEPVILSEDFKTNWCQAKQGRCPNGEFPTEGPEAELIRLLFAHYNTLFPASINFGRQDIELSPDTRRPQNPIADFKIIPDRCCQTQVDPFVIVHGEVKDYLQRSCYFPRAQLTSIGSCFAASNTGGCTRGKCTQQTGLVYMHCMNLTTTAVVYRPFEMNSTCSCLYTSP